MTNAPTPPEIVAFKKKLRAAQCEILANSNQWEVCRFRSSMGVGVVYRNSRGNLKWNEAAIQVRDMLAGSVVNLSPIGALKSTKKGRKREQRLAALRSRDGDLCFYCGGLLSPHPLPHDHPYSTTIEEVYSRAQGGATHLFNQVLAHKRCNNLVGDLPVIEKVKLRETWPHPVIDAKEKRNADQSNTGAGDPLPPIPGPANGCDLPGAHP